MFNLNFNNFPKLYIGNRGGGTDYIDFIKWKEVTEPVMIGTDRYNRAFIVVKFILNKETKKPIKIIQTFFQRYSNDNLWMGCGHATEHLIKTPGGMKYEQFRFLERIINGETLKLSNNIYPVFPVNTSVSLYDEKKWNASIVIQKNWRLCRYNPRYKMCEKVQCRNMENLLF